MFTLVDELSPNEVTVQKDLSLVEHRSPTAAKSKPKKVRKPKKNTASAAEDKVTILKYLNQIKMAKLQITLTGFREIYTNLDLSLTKNLCAKCNKR
jgi:hypothetical protein